MITYLFAMNSKKSISYNAALSQSVLVDTKNLIGNTPQKILDRKALMHVAFHSPNTVTCVRNAFYTYENNDCSNGLSRIYN